MPADNTADFRTYLESSLRNPFNISLKGCTLMEVIRVAVREKEKLHPNYGSDLRIFDEYVRDE